MSEWNTDISSSWSNWSENFIKYLRNWKIRTFCWLWNWFECWNIEAAPWFSSLSCVPWWMETWVCVWCIISGLINGNFNALGDHRRYAMRLALMTSRLHKHSCSSGHSCAHWVGIGRELIEKFNLVVANVYCVSPAVKATRVASPANNYGNSCALIESGSEASASREHFEPADRQSSHTQRKRPFEYGGGCEQQCAPAQSWKRQPIINKRDEPAGWLCVLIYHDERIKTEKPAPLQEVFNYFI